MPATYFEQRRHSSHYKSLFDHHIHLATSHIIIVITHLDMYRAYFPFRKSRKLKQRIHQTHQSKNEAAITMNIENAAVEIWLAEETND